MVSEDFSKHHYSDVTVMSQECHGISNHWQLDCLLNSLFRLTTTTKIPKLCITGPLWGESTSIGGFPSQRASYAESICMSRPRHDAIIWSGGCLARPHITQCVGYTITSFITYKTGVEITLDFQQITSALIRAAFCWWKPLAQSV